MPAARATVAGTPPCTRLRSRPNRPARGCAVSPDAAGGVVGRVRGGSRIPARTRRRRRRTRAPLWAAIDLARRSVRSLLATCSRSSPSYRTGNLDRRPTTPARRDSTGRTSPAGRGRRPSASPSTQATSTVSAAGTTSTTPGSARLPQAGRPVRRIGAELLDQNRTAAPSAGPAPLPDEAVDADRGVARAPSAPRGRARLRRACRRGCRSSARRP